MQSNQIQLKKLSITNFKGIARFEAQFNAITNIYGENATGKTSLFDAFLWLFFGKDSEGKSAFEIKRLDHKGNFISKLNTEVEAFVVINGVEIVAKKVLQQKWTKRRGSNEEQYSGDENVYYWNDVPLKETDFKVKVNQHITNEQLFMLISNPFYFNSLKWEDRRKMLTSIAPDITDDYILSKLSVKHGEDVVKPLREAFSQKKTITEFGQQISASIKKAKDQLADLPARIEEAKRSINHGIDFGALKKSAEAISKQINDIDLLIADTQKQQELQNQKNREANAEYQKRYQEHQNNLFAQKSKLQALYNSISQQARETATKLKQEIEAKRFNLNSVSNNILSYSSEVERIHIDVSRKNEELTKLRNEYLEIDAKQFQFDESTCKCPTCLQSLPVDTINTQRETLLGNFNTEKQKRLTENITAGKRLKQEVEELQKRIVAGNQQIDLKKKEHTILVQDIEALELKLQEAYTDIDTVFAQMLNNSPEYKSLKEWVEELEKVVIQQPELQHVGQDSISEIVAKKQQLNIQLQEINRELAKESFNQQQQQRVNELVGMEEKLLQEQNTLEGIDFIINQFNKAKIEAIEESINGLFNYVKFKMFKIQVNGGETPTCETLVNSNGSWVPYTSANNAARINAGLDIINAFSFANKINAPVFIDNREGVSQLIPTMSQVINLYVSSADKQLRVS